MKHDITTEEKIKEVARKLFYEKGYSATKTRDIASQAGINIALLHYYFRSKENLFDMIMLEGFREMFSLVSDVINDPTTNIADKIDAVSTRYLDLIVSNPALPLFVINELRLNPDLFIKQVRLPHNMLADSLLFKQMQEQIDKEGLQVRPIHIMANMVSMALLPSIGKPFVSHLYEMDDDAYKQFIDQRRHLIPLWVKQMLNINE